MLTKFALTALILVLAWLLLFRRPRRPRMPRDDSRALPHPLQFARCPTCGTYRLPQGKCDCTRDDAGS